MVEFKKVLLGDEVIEKCKAMISIKVGMGSHFLGTGKMCLQDRAQRGCRGPTS